ncbi:MAG: DUF1573 domain-containing protein [Muribaculaceae bacterium]|nr:DUF1573 domain-containing protein [Muribaculaceae bacterium]
MMLIADTLVVIGLATAPLGTIQEMGGVQEHTYWLRNDGTEAVTLQQGYTSCECTTIEFERYAQVQPGDSSQVVLRFNPQGRGGEFNVSGTVVYGAERKRVKLSMTGTSILSEETLMKRYPIAVSDNLRLSTDRFDLGVMYPGETKERSVVVLHRDEEDRAETLSIAFTPDAKTPKGLQHIPYTVITTEQGKQRHLTIILDVMIK